MKNKISFVTRHYVSLSDFQGDYIYYVHRENGDVEQYSQKTLTKEARRFISKAENFQFCDKSGEFYHKFS